MIVGIFGRQFERFRSLPILVEMSNERTRKGPVVAATAEDEPTPVARPRVIALRIVGVALCKWPNVACLQVHQPQVGIVVPDMEIAEFPYREEQETPVGRDAWEGDTLVDSGSIEHQFSWPELSAVGVETLAIEVVFEFLETPNHLRGFLLCCVLTLEMGAAIVESLAVGAPRWEHLEFLQVVLQIRHFVTFHVVSNDVALFVKHLHFVGIDGVEVLMRLVCGVDNEIERRVPGRIDTSREDGIVLHVHFLDLPVVDDDGAAVALTCVELHALRVVLLVVVAVDALSVTLEATQHIVVDDTLVVVFQTTLVDGQRLVRHKRRSNQTIADVRVDGVGRNMDVERLEVIPLRAVARVNIHRNVASFRFLRQSAPFVDVGLSVAHDGIVADSVACHHLVASAIELESQRSNVHGHRHVNIVRIYRGQLARFHVLSGQLRTATGNE